MSSAGDRRALDRSRSRRQMSGFNSASSIKLTDEISIDNLTADDFGASPTLQGNSGGKAPRRKKYTSMEEATNAEKSHHGPGSPVGDALLAELKAL